MEFMVLIYLFFIFISIYFSFLFLILYFSNKNFMLEDDKAKNIPTLTVLIPAWNIGKMIGKAIKCIKKVDYPKNKLEIIIIDKESKDRTAEIAKKYGVKVIKIKNQDVMNQKSAVLNFGLKHAKGEIIAIVDADSRPTKDSFLKMVSKFENNNVGAVTSSILVKNDKKWIEKMQEIEYAIIAWSRKLFEFLGCVYVTPGALSMYRTKYAKKIGGFDDDNLTEDIDIAWRMLKEGYDVKMSLGAKVWTIVPSKINVWWKQRIRWHIGGLQTTKKHIKLFGKKSHGLLGMFIVPFFMSSFVLSLLGFGVTSYYLGKRVLRFILLNAYSKDMNISPIQLDYLNLLPTVFTFFMVVLFILTLVYVIFGLVTINPKKMGLKRIITAEIYILVYLIFYPLILLNAMWWIIRKKYEW